MERSLIFSRGKLADFLACRRRYQLRYEERLAWPIGPPQEKAAVALERGRRFHQLLQRHFLGLPVTPPGEEQVLSQWWQLFKAYGPELPSGRRLPEFNLTVPIGRHFLTGRYDLLIAGQGALHIYDWKTGVHPLSATRLRDELQTRVYLALAAEGAGALSAGVAPEVIRLTYWYAGDPPVTRALAYDAAWHAENWAYLRVLVNEIERDLATSDQLPLTDDLGQCRRCAYQAYCGRLADGLDLVDWNSEDAPLQLEPDRP